ncbi:cysteine hydrolase family protein [Streptomyces sp. NRRL WC-3742]|uniref:cysteine hydrolase family protein n=1 Tax=Streptomyces sp. NRRL WC-3742 TaxID=1463934 RepID=UPI00068E7999|nr:isochorismatase family cysteine hydrolase [Streptomyces sp. NRRL WC-3742]
MTDTPASPATGSVLVLVDLQQWIVDRPVAPLPGEAVVRSAVRLKDAFAAAGRPVVLVRHARLDRSDGGPDSHFNRFAAGLEAGPGDGVVTKYAIDAFAGTDLAERLERLGAQDVVVAGIATEWAVSETARTARLLGYPVTVVEDACSALSAPAHAASLASLREFGVRIVPADAFGGGATDVDF